MREPNHKIETNTVPPPDPPDKNKNPSLRIRENIGAVDLQVSFNTMSSLALQPMMCYSHPNGASSLLKHPGVLCGSLEQRLMQVLGSIMLACMVAFFASCSWALWHIPQWILTNERRDLARSQNEMCCGSVT